MDRLLDELRLEGDAYAQTRQALLLRLLALEEAWREGIVPTPEMIRSAAERFSYERGIEEQKSFQRWLQGNYISQSEFLELMKDEACLEWVQNQAEMQAAALAPDHLRVAGQYVRLANRARDKQRVLESRGLQYPSLMDAGLAEDELVRWYFEEHLRRPVAADLAQYCRDAGFEDESSFRRTILREYCYTGFVGSGSGVG